LGFWGIGDLAGDDIFVIGSVSKEGSASILTSKTSLSDFSYFIGSGPSSTQSFNLIGSNLTSPPGDIIVTGPSCYNVSTDNINFSANLNIQYTTSNLSETPIYIRLKPGLSAGEHNNEIISISGGGTSQTVECNGFVSAYNLVINEIFADPDNTSLAGDANNDGVSDVLQDEFVEIVNIGDSDIDLANFTLRDATTLRHTFSAVTLPTGLAVVVFGGGNLTNFTDSFSQTSSSGRLRLEEGGDVVTLQDNSGRKVATYTFGAEGANLQSLARNPDFTGPFVQHSTILSNPVNFSPGKDNTDASPLPVELSSFSKLKWGTETEVSNYGFEILRSTQNDNWQLVGFIEGHGNSNSPKEYSFIDNNVTAGKYSYRLKQIDTDGKFEYSKIIEIEFGSPIKYELSKNYPNPFNPATTIRYSLPESGSVKLMVFNLLGEEVEVLVNEMKEAGIHTVNFNASNLNSGLYVYKIETNEFVQSRKMILLK